MTDIRIAHLVDRFYRRVYAGLNARAPEFDRHNVGPMGGTVLLTLAELEPARIQQIVTAMARDKSQMTRIVKSLEHKGLVERGGLVEDARVSMLSLTDEGKVTVQELQIAISGVLDTILSPLSSKERDQLSALLAKL
jgi:DNA-binding MarR family transcriptional regulator